MLIIENLKKSFDGFIAINGVSLSIQKGTICSIIGPNGAGKTTLFNLITGHIHVDQGKLTFKGVDITHMSPNRICRLGIGRSFQRANIFPRLTVFENIQAAILVFRGMGFNFYKSVKSLFLEETEAILKMVGLFDAKDEMSISLSYGAQKQLEIGIALASEPELLLLDEPTAGMSLQETKQTIELIARIVLEKGLTLLFTEHDMDVVFSISQRITVLHQGKVIAEGSPDQVRNDPYVQRVYIGDVR